MGAMGENDSVLPITLSQSEQSARHSRESFDFTGMTPDEIVQIHRDILPNPEDYRPDEVIDGLTDAFIYGMEDLCTNRPDVAADVLEILAASTSFDERGTAAGLLAHLAVASRQAAKILSETLLRDPDLAVREAARIALTEARKIGAFSLTETLHLLRIYNRVDEADTGDSYHYYA